MNNVREGSVVQASGRVVDEGVVFAEIGDLGRVVGVDLDGEVIALTVAWANAPRVTTSYLGEDCQLSQRPALIATA